MPESKSRRLQEIEARAGSIEDEMASLNAACGSIKQQILTLKKTPKDLSRENEQLRAEVKMLRVCLGERSCEDYQAAMKKLKYSVGCLHIGFAGCAGVGKSSLVNAIRGLRKGDPGAAATGYIERTAKTKGYPALDNDKVIYYDMPGINSVRMSCLNYFKEQGLYLMQAIVIVWHYKIMSRDVETMAACIIAKIPFLLVRSRTDENIGTFREDVANDWHLDLWDPDQANNPHFISAVADKVEEFQRESREAATESIIAAYEKVKCSVPANYPYEERVLLVNSRSLYKWVTERHEDVNAIDEKRFEECLLRLCA